jgi:hypothetical protein
MSTPLSVLPTIRSLFGSTQISWHRQPKSQLADRYLYGGGRPETLGPSRYPQADRLPRLRDSDPGSDIMGGCLRSPSSEIWAATIVSTSRAAMGPRPDGTSRPMAMAFPTTCATSSSRRAWAWQRVSGGQSPRDRVVAQHPTNPRRPRCTLTRR